MAVYYLKKGKSPETLPYSIIPVSDDDPLIIIDRYKPIILNESANNSIEPAVIASIIYTESRGNSEAQRYLSRGDYVYGLMQMRLSTAVLELNYSGKTANLLLPSVNISLGTRYLAKLRDKYRSIVDAISAYNQGTPAKNDDGTYKNQQYVNAVINLIVVYRKAFLALFPDYFSLFWIDPIKELEV